MGHFKGTFKFTYLKFAAKVQQISDICKYIAHFMHKDMNHVRFYFHSLGLRPVSRVKTRVKIVGEEKPHCSEIS